MGMDIDVLPDDPYDPPRSKHNFIWNASGDERAFIVFTGIESIRIFTGVPIISELPVFAACVRARYLGDTDALEWMIQSGWVKAAGAVTFVINNYALVLIRPKSTLLLTYQGQLAFFIAVGLVGLNAILYSIALWLAPRALRYVENMDRIDKSDDY